MIDSPMARETSLGLSGLLFGKTVAGMAGIALTVLPTDGMATPTAFLRVDHLRREFQDLLELINRGPCLGMLPRFKAGHLSGVASLTEATHHQASSDSIIGGFVVASVAIDTCHPMLTHRALSPRNDEARVDLFMAPDTDSIILLGGYAVEVQTEKD
jgi:hypothetical protein